MKLGYTGTQNGMNDFQKNEFRANLDKYNPNEFHHGDCIGADMQAHFIFLNWHIAHDTEQRTIIIHPPTNPGKMAYCGVVDRYHVLLKEKLVNCKYKVIIKMLEAFPYLERNRYIVDAVDVMIACPKEMEHTLRSGTWTTVRYSWHQKKETIVIPPIESEG